VYQRAHPLNFSGGRELEEQLRIIYEAQKIDVQIIENERKMVHAPMKFDAMTKEMEDIQEKVEREKGVMEELDKERKKKEKELEAEKEKIKKFESRLYEVKTNKEYQALLKEIETAKQSVDKMEEEIIFLMEKIEDLKTDFQKSSVFLKKREKEIEEERGKLEKGISSIDKTMLELKTARAKLLSLVSKDLKTTYTMLVERRSGVAVVNVKNDVCLGCFMNIPPQLYIEVTKNNRLIQCPSCSRILFFVEDDE
jgi:predicted  nucleic acid-binding Zn-ribbon protein